MLDTNVVLDWLYFRDLRAVPLGEAIRDGRVRWFVAPTLESELLHVLGRDVGRRGQEAVDETVRGWQRWAEPLDLQAPTVPRGLHCTDPDDQKFVDLAWRLGDAVLLSADRAVLRLRSRAAREGLTIMRLEDWTSHFAGGG